MSILILQDPADFIFFPLIKYLHRKYRKGKIRLLFFQKCLEVSKILPLPCLIIENMDISSDDEDFILENLEMFQLQPIGASSVGEYEHIQGNIQAENPTLAPQIDSSKPANQEILQLVPERSIQQTDPSPLPQHYVQLSSDSAQQLDEVPQQLGEGAANMPEPKRFKSMNETELKYLQDNYHQSKATKQNTRWGVKLFQGVLCSPFCRYK